MTVRAPLLPPPEFNEQGVTLSDVTGMLYRQRWLILGCTVVVAVLSVVLVKAQDKVYTSTARVWVQTEQQGTPAFLTGIAAYRDNQYPEPVNRKIETEMELMLARSSAESVIRQLGIHDDQLVQSPFAQLVGKVSKPLKGALAGLKSLFSGTAAPAEEPLPVDLFLDAISVEPLRSKTSDTSSNVLEVSFSAADRELAPKALQVLLDNYLRIGAAQNRRLGESTARLIQDRMVAVQQELSDAENGITALALQKSASEGAMRTFALPPQTPGRNAGLMLDLSASPGSSEGEHALNSLRGQVLDLQAQLEALRQYYTDDAPNVRAVRQRLGAAQGRLAEQVRSGVQAETEMVKLDRRRALAQDRYVELRQRLDQIELYLQANAHESQSRVVIDPPYAPLASEGKRRSVLAVVGAVGGLILGLLLGGLRELMDTRFHGPREVERLLGLPVLGQVPVLSGPEQERLMRRNAPVVTTTA